MIRFLLSLSFLIAGNQLYAVNLPSYNMENTKKKNISRTPMTVTLPTVITVSTVLNQTDIDNMIWPVIIENGTEADPVVVELGEDIVFNLYDHYFVVNSNYIVINGNDHTVTIQNLVGYRGIVENGYDYASARSNLHIKNIGVLAAGSSTLSNDGGWIGRVFFGSSAVDNLVSNCFSNGPIGSGAGGIIGAFAACKISDCYSTGSIGENGGGIAGKEGGGMEILNCYSIGTIGVFAGGIMGSLSTASTVTNCYSVGTIGDFAGGIVGNDHNTTIVDCYTTGAVSSSDAGTIMPPTGISTVNHCFGSNGSGWSDLDAAEYLSGLDNSVWVPIETSIPVRLASFNRPLYDPNHFSVNVNTSHGVYPISLGSGTYSIISITPSVPSNTSINSTTGELSFGNASTPGTYTVQIFYDGDNDSYRITNFTFTLTAVLPVSWLSFEVKQKGTSSLLQWSTAREDNTHQFEIQRSANQNAWSTIGRVAAKGNSTTSVAYNYTDINPVTALNFYRLKQTDIDGKFSYSPIRSVLINTINTAFTLLNNPVTNKMIQVKVNEVVLLSIYNNDGKMIWQKKLNPGTQSIDISTAPQGLYFLSGAGIVHKIIVQ